MDNSSNTPLDSLGDILENAPGLSENDDPPLARASEDRYFCREEGQETGPYTISQLQAMVDQDQLHKPDRIRHTDSKCWLPCQEISELVFPTVDRAHDKEIEAASSLLNELFSDAGTSGFSPEIPALENLPEVTNPTPRKVSSHVEKTPPLVTSTDEKPAKTAAPLKSSRKLAVAEGTPPKSTSASRSSPTLPAADHKAQSCPPDAVAAVHAVEHRTATSQQSQDAKMDLPKAHGQAASFPQWNAPVSAPSKPVPAEKPKKKTRSVAGPRFSLPSQLLLIGLGVLILNLLLVKFWPASSSGMKGLIAIDGKPLTVGSLSLTNPNAFEHAMSFSVMEGQFQSADRLPDGEYDAQVVVGSPLGMPVAQLENTPFQSLNGARFQAKVTVSSDSPEIKLDLPASQAIPLDKGAGGDAISSQ